MERLETSFRCLLRWWRAQGAHKLRLVLMDDVGFVCAHVVQPLRCVRWGRESGRIMTAPVGTVAALVHHGAGCLNGWGMSARQDTGEGAGGLRYEPSQFSVWTACLGSLPAENLCLFGTGPALMHWGGTCAAVRQGGAAASASGNGDSNQDSNRRRRRRTPQPSYYWDVRYKIHANGT